MLRLGCGDRSKKRVKGHLRLAYWRTEGHADRYRANWRRNCLEDYTKAEVGSFTWELCQDDKGTF